MANAAVRSSSTWPAAGSALDERAPHSVDSFGPTSIPSTAAAQVDTYHLTDVVAEYGTALRIAGRSPRTIRWYLDQLQEFIRFLERDGLVATLAELSPVSIR